MIIIKTVKGLKEEILKLKNNGKSIGLVPTMGALHEGHISLVKQCRKDNDIVVVSVFVNPTQFNNKEDLRTYPRTEEADAKLLENSEVDILFMPTPQEIYPEPDNRIFKLGQVAEVMEGPMRPGHFNGVAQIVSKLFDFASPDRAYFGEKDFQQIAVIKSMVSTERYNVKIIPCPIVRESDGLAKSSRNVRLSSDLRKIAPNIYKILCESITFAKSHTVSETQQYVISSINAFSDMKVEYYQIVNGLTMQNVSNWSDSTNIRGCITVYCGDVRLIDNIAYTL